MRAAIYGAGSLGTILGAFISKNGGQIDLINHNEKIEQVQGKDIVKLLDYRNPFKKAVSFFIIPLAIKKHALLKASMLQDIERGKKTEVDSINGAVCAQGRKVSVPTPCNDKVVEIIHRIENGELKAERSNLQFFERV